MVIDISHKYITKVQQLGEEFTHNDGLGMWSGKEYHVHDCVIDMSECDNVDEAVAVTYGSSCTFERCVIRNASKLCLIGSGDEKVRHREYDKKVSFYYCILENFGRRGVEAQSGMQVTMMNCLIKNWGSKDYFDVRNFASWSHDEAVIRAYNCIFMQDSFFRPIKQFFKDLGNHIGQTRKDEGIKALFKPSTYRLGVRRGLVATDTGKVYASGCYKNHWWIHLDNHADPMEKDKADELLEKLDAMKEQLYVSLVR